MDPTAQFLVATLVVFYLLLVFGMSMLRPASAMWILASAPTPAVHYLQLITRIMVGAGFVGLAPRLMFSPVFTILGWAFMISSGILLLVPWRLRSQAGERALQRLKPYVRYIGMASLILCIMVIASLARTDAA